ncbi:MAG: hypothetical protein RL757_255 [Bacteroidota bacterium]|jgi:Spy/CpxP family protein refolding chaperone
MRKVFLKKRFPRRFRLLCGVLLLTKMAASAQTVAHTHHDEQVYPATESEVGRFAQQEQKLYKTLKLSPEQFKKIDDINDAYVLKIVQLKADKNLDKNAKKTLRSEAKKERDEKFRAILTTPQLNKWNKWKQFTAVRKAKKMDKKGLLPK